MVFSSCSIHRSYTSFDLWSYYECFTGRCRMAFPVLIFPSISVHYGTKISKSKTQMLNRSKKGNKLLTKLKMIESISKKLVEFIGHWLFVFIFNSCNINPLFKQAVLSSFNKWSIVWSQKRSFSMIKTVYY